MLTVFAYVFHNPGIARVTCLFAAVKTQRRLTVAKNKSLLHLLDVAHKGGVPALWWREKLQVIKCFFGLNRKHTHGTAETQTIVQKIHRDYVIRFKALESTAALFCTFDQSFQKNVITIPAFIYIYCIYINTSKELQNSKLSAVSASVTVVFVGVAVGWQKR